MTKATVRHLFDDAYEDLSEFQPDSLRHFKVEVNFFLSHNGVDWGDKFTFCVCSPSRLEIMATAGEVFWGRALLVMEKYDYAVISAHLHKLIASFDEDDFGILALKLSNYVEWEGLDFYLKKVVESKP